MVRRFASFVAVLPLLLAAGLAMSLAQAPQFLDEGPRFSAPCEPASPAFQAAVPEKAVAKVAGAVVPPVIGASGVAVAEGSLVAVPPVRWSAPQKFPPTFRRPPPVNS